MVSLRRRQVIIAGLATPALLPAFLPTASWSFEIPGKLVLSGRVLGRGGKPLSGATVSVGADRAATDADGRFVLVTTKGEPYRVSFAGLSEQGSVADARRDLDGTWRASFGLTLA